MHEIDERFVADMKRYAARRFSGIWQATLDVFEDLEQEVQLASPWSVCGAVDGRAVVDWYLIEKGRYLSAERARLAFTSGQARRRRRVASRPKLRWRRSEEPALS